MALDGSDDDDDDDSEDEDPAFGSIRRAKIPVADSPNHEPAVLTPTKAPTPKARDGFGGIRGQSSEDEDEDDDDDDDDDDSDSERPAGQESQSDSDGEIDPDGKPLTRHELREMIRKENDKRQYFVSEEYKREVYRRKIEKEHRAHERFETMLGSVMEGIDGGGLVADTNEKVYRREMARDKKTKEIHAEWEKEIFAKISEQIKAQVDKIDARDLNTRLVNADETYRSVVNRKMNYHPKAGIFLDTILGHDYDPFEHQPEWFKYSVDALKDPMKRDLHKSIKEDLAAGLISLEKARILAKLEAKLRDTAAPASAIWSNSDYTMYGRYTDANGEELPPDAPIPGFFRQGQHLFNRHDVELNKQDHFDYPRGNEHAEAEWRRTAAHRRAHVGDHNAGGLKDMGKLLGLAGNVEHGPGAETGTDRWLVKSKKKQWDKPTAPGHSPSRKDLFDVMQNKGYRGAYDKNAGGPAGDAWLASRGRHCFQELPIQKSDRKSLYSVMQHDAKGSLDAGQRVGDKWLDRKLKNPVRHRRYSGHPDGDIYGLLTHTNTGPHALGEIC
jgi:hypothetical protein